MKKSGKGKATNTPMRRTGREHSAQLPRTEVYDFFLCSSAVLSTMKNHWPWRSLIRTDLASVGRTKCQECIELHPHFNQQAGPRAGNSMLLALISDCPACLASLLPPNECKYDGLRFDLLLRTPYPPTTHPPSCVP